MRIKNILGKKILLIPEKSDEIVTNSGIILPQFARTARSKFTTGGILMVGTMLKEEDYPVGSVVKYLKGSGSPHRQPNEKGEETDYLILEEREILFLNDRICGDRLMVLPCKEEKSNLYIPQTSTVENNHILKGIVVQRGAELVANNPNGIHEKYPVYYYRGSGIEYEEENNKYLILSREEIIFCE